MQAHSLAAALLAWITLHRSGTQYAYLFGESTEELMAKVACSPIKETHPDLLRQANLIIANMDPGVG
jgi:hypothetical protein